MALIFCWSGFCTGQGGDDFSLLHSVWGLYWEDLGTEDNLILEPRIIGRIILSCARSHLKHLSVWVFFSLSMVASRSLDFIHGVSIYKTEAASPFLSLPQKSLGAVPWTALVKTRHTHTPSLEERSVRSHWRIAHGMTWEKVMMIFGKWSVHCFSTEINMSCNKIFKTNNDYVGKLAFGENKVILWTIPDHQTSCRGWLWQQRGLLWTSEVTRKTSVGH